MSTLHLAYIEPRGQLDMQSAESAFQLGDIGMRCAEASQIDIDPSSHDVDPRSDNRLEVGFQSSNPFAIRYSLTCRRAGPFHDEMPEDLAAVGVCR